MIDQRFVDFIHGKISNLNKPITIFQSIEYDENI